MKIAFDLRRIRNLGIGRYMKCLVEAILAQEPLGDYLLILPPGAEGMIQGGSNSAKTITPKLKYYSIREQIQLPRILRDHKVDLLHSPHFMLPLMRPCASVVTIHDVIGLTWKEDLRSRIGRVYYRWMISAAVRLADRIITDSKFSRDDIVRCLGVDREKLKVVYPGISPDFQQVNDNVQLENIRTKYRIQNDYIVYTGIYKPRKNHAALLRAFQSFLSSERHANLVLVGPLSEGEQELRRLADELGIREKVIFTGFVNDCELRTLYSAAKVYACPSLYEGFGFTVLESMACGTPVVCSADTSLPEVAADAALYANPRNPEEFALALHNAFTNDNLRRALIEKGRQNLLRFDWANTARETLGVYQDALRVSLRQPRAGLSANVTNPNNRSSQTKPDTNLSGWRRT
jgi:glycosyltransferase involved in cell wall biosynthesis